MKEQAKTNSSVPQIQGSERIQAALTEVRDNMSAIETENYRIPRAKMSGSGFVLAEDCEPVTEIQGVLIHAKKTNVYYEKPFNPNNPEPPTCFSLDGDMPDASIEHPVNETCRGCPMSEFGTNSMKSGKACRNMKPLFMIRKGEDGLSIIPRQITVSPTSLKAANQYLMDLTERGLSYKKVVTKITAFRENPKDTYSKLRFQMVEKLDQADSLDVDAIRNYWLPIMNRQLGETEDVQNSGAKEF